MRQKKNIRAFHRALHDWYAAHGRHHLPWRTTPDPYHIWVSEVMLQQTLVATVLARYYHPFLEKFPTIEALAKAERDAVMKAWEGLGYYRRAGFLHEAAKRILAQHGGNMPATVEDLLALPGIGRNTAHAVASFGFGAKLPVMEANLKRVLARIFAWKTPADNQLWDAAYHLLDEDKPFDYNQAMMDIGATICLPRKPLCMLCPANVICEGKAAPEAYPAPKAKREKPVRHRILLMAYRVTDGVRRYHLSVRETALLGGLYGFPQLEMEEKGWSHAGHNVSIGRAERLGQATHQFSHFGLVCNVMTLDVTRALPPGNDWYSREEIAALPVAAIDRKALALLTA